MRGSSGEGSHFVDGGARPPSKGKGAAVGSRQRGRRDVAAWPPRQRGRRDVAAWPPRQRGRRDVAAWPPRRETDSPQLQETVMHRVNVIVHCTATV